MTAFHTVIQNHFQSSQYYGAQDIYVPHQSSLCRPARINSEVRTDFCNEEFYPESELLIILGMSFSVTIINIPTRNYLERKIFSGVWFQKFKVSNQVTSLVRHLVRRSRKQGENNWAQHSICNQPCQQIPKVHPITLSYHTEPTMRLHNQTGCTPLILCL